MLDAYLLRIGLNRQPDPTAEGLESLQRAHRLAIAFENFDVMLNRPIDLALPAVWAKLGGARGGYCFEQNALFGAMLAEIGLSNRPLLGRVWMGLEQQGITWPGDPQSAPPRTHTLRLVEIGAEQWVADAGFGGSYVPPLPLIDGAQCDTADGASHRLSCTRSTGHDSPVWLLERRGPATTTDGRGGPGNAWTPQYSFDLGSLAAADLELANWWTSTRPGMRFTTACRASIPLPEGFVALNDRALSVHAQGSAQETVLATPAEWRAALADLFRIDLSLDEIDRLRLF